MIIKDIVARNILIPLNNPKVCAAMRVTNRPYTLVGVLTDQGVEGWSYVGGTPVIKHVVAELKPLLVGERLDIPRLWHKVVDTNMVRADRGGTMMRAISAIDIALWDAAGKAAGLPIHAMIGRYRDRAPVYYSGGYYPRDDCPTAELLAYTETEYARARERGFRAFKMKIGVGHPRVDIERIALVRSIIGSDCRLMLDANCAYSRETAVAVCREVEPYFVDWFEEPVAVDNYEDWRFIADRVSVPLAAGETHFIRRQFTDILRGGAIRVLQPNPTLMGGFTEFLNLAGAAALGGVSLAPHVSHDVSVQLALARREIVTMEYMDAESDVFTIHRVLENPVMAVNGEVVAPDGAGHGLRLDERAVERYLV